MPEAMTQFRTEGQPAFPIVDTENDNSASSSEGEETTTTEGDSAAGEDISDDTNKKPVEGEEGEDKGFADHPRWKEREEDHKKRFNEQETRHVGEIAKLREEMEAKIAGLAPKGKGEGETATEIPPWFNGDDAQWSQFQEWNKGLVSQSLAEREKQSEENKKAEDDRVKEATDYFHSEVTAIEADKELNPTGAKIDRNKLLKTAQDFDLVTSDGKWNYRAAFRFLSNAQTKTKPDTTGEKKKIAGATIAGKGAGSGEGPKIFGSKDFEKPGNRPW